MKTIEIELSNARGFGLLIGRHNSVAIDFGEASLRDIIDALGIGKVLDEIGKVEVIEHFDIDVAE